jgi:RHS repeat-associated protein
VVRKVYRLGGETVAVREGSTVYAAVGDHLGSVTVLAQGGSVAGATRYLPYGAIRWESGLWSTDRRFTGQRWEASLGLYDYRARFYDPALGRFLQPDPLVPQAGDPSSLNRYAYARLNPLRYVDPTGHCWGPVSFVRGLPGYGVTCGNLEMALTIVQHPQATWEQKLLAGGYIAVEGAAHGALLVGLGMLAWEGGSALLAGGSAAGGVVQAACADADCTNEVRAAAQVTQRVWEMNPLQRGQMLHRIFGQNLPDRFPVVDRMVWEEGRMISIKTLDLGAKSYQNLARLQQVVQGYIQKLAEFNEASYLGVSIEPQHIKIRELWLVIPGANEGQWKVLQALQELAAQSDVVLRIILWPSGGRR